MEDEGEGRSGKAGLGLGWTFGGTATKAQDSLSDLACLLGELEEQEVRNSSTVRMIMV